MRFTRRVGPLTLVSEVVSAVVGTVVCVCVCRVVYYETNKCQSVGYVVWSEEQGLLRLSATCSCVILLDRGLLLPTTNNTATSTSTNLSWPFSPSICIRICLFYQFSSIKLSFLVDWFLLNNFDIHLILIDCN